MDFEFAAMNLDELRGEIERQEISQALQEHDGRVIEGVFPELDEDLTPSLLEDCVRRLVTKLLDLQSRMYVMEALERRRRERISELGWKPNLTAEDLFRALDL